MFIKQRLFERKKYSIVYIYILIKIFNFKITNISYIKKDTKIDSNMNSLNDFFKDKDILDPRISELFYPPTLYQCSDLTDFPKNFN